MIRRTERRIPEARQAKKNILITVKDPKKQRMIIMGTDRTDTDIIIPDITVSNLIFNYLPSPIVAGALAMIAGLIVVPVVSLITPKMDESKLTEIFNCYSKVVQVEKKMYLEDDEDKPKED